VEGLVDDSAAMTCIASLKVSHLSNVVRGSVEEVEDNSKTPKSLIAIIN